MKRLEGWPMRRREFIAGLGSASAWPLVRGRVDEAQNLDAVAGR
jgi:hypothetical protein